MARGQAGARSICRRFGKPLFSLTCKVNLDFKSLTSSSFHWHLAAGPRCDPFRAKGRHTMGRSKALILATLVAAGASSAAFGADLLPPPPRLEPPPPMDVGGGWYLRGDVGVGALQMNSWRSTLQPSTRPDSPSPTRATCSFPLSPPSAITTFAGVGVGYQFNHWFRADITGEYRTEATYRAGIAGAQHLLAGWTGFDTYNGGVSTALFMANGYFDLGTWHCITPFVGGGVGVAAHKFAGLTDSRRRRRHGRHADQLRLGGDGGPGAQCDAQSQDRAWLSLSRHGRQSRAIRSIACNLRDAGRRFTPSTSPPTTSG